MTKEQFKILKTFTDWPKADLQKISKVFKVFKVPLVNVQAVQHSLNYKQYQEAGADFLSNLFGGKL